MSDQGMEMQFADPDWQPASSQIIQPTSRDSNSETGQRARIRRHRSTPLQFESRRQRQLLFVVARVASVVVWFTTPLITRAFHGGWIVPLLGVLFLPLTTLTYTIVAAVAGSVTGLGWLWVIGALLFDLVSYSGQTSKRRSGLPQSGK